MRTTIKWMACLAMGLNASTALADNPIIQTYYSPDPAPVVIDDTVFVYTGNDQGGDFFTMNGWRVSSSTDMVNWTDRGTIILSHEDFPNAKVAGDWAAQCIRRNGKYYYYVTVESTYGGRAVNVAVADRPEGPFKNALPGRDHLAGPNWDYIDPTVWIDDDGQAYLYWGNPKLYYAKLNEDMISFDGKIQVTDMSRGFGPNGQGSKYTEGPWIHKHNGKYYMIYASHGIPESISYSWSDNPTGPWEWKGVIMDSNNQGGAFTNHSGLIEFKGRNFFFYHNQRLPGGGGYTRSTAVEEFTWNADGTIPLMKMTNLGIEKPIHYLDPFKRVEAETKAYSKGLDAGKNNNGVYITKIHNNDYIKVRCVDFGDMGGDFFTASVSSRNNASIEIRLDKEDGELIGTLNIENTNGGWKELECEVANCVGIHDLYFIFKGAGNTELFDFDYWYFTSNAVIVPQTPYQGIAQQIPGKIEFENYDEGGQNRAYYDNDMENQGKEYREDRVDIVTNEEGYSIGYTVKDEWLEYTVNVKETRAYEYEARVSSGLDGAGFQLLIDDKPITENIEVPNTDDWNVYEVIKGTTSEISEGEHILKVLITGGYANLDWLKFAGDGDETITIDNNADILKGITEISVFDMNGKKLGDLKVDSAQDNDIASKLKNAGYTNNTYIIKAGENHKVIICK